MDTVTPASRPSDPSPWRAVYPNDTVGNALVYSLERAAEPPQRPVLTQLDTYVAQWSIVVVVLAVSLLALASLVTGWNSNESDNWTEFWILIVASVLCQLLLLPGIWYVHRERNRRPGRADGRPSISIRALRQAALSGDDVLAPRVTTYDEPQAPSYPVSDGATFTVPPSQSRLQKGDRVLWGIGTVLWAFMLLMQIVPRFNQPVDWQVFAVYSLVGIEYLSLFIWATLRGRMLRVEGREDGLYWRKRTIPWTEVRGWYILFLHPVNTADPHPNVVHILVGQRASFSWLAYPQFVRADEPGQRLAEYVQRHVSLPLRDLTPSAIHLSTEVAQRSPWRRSRLLATTDRQVWGVSIPRLRTVVPTLALSLLLLLAGILMPYAQQWYFGGQLNRLEASTTALHDPLTANTLQWTTTQDAAKSFAFTPTGYVFLSTTCCDASSLIAQPATIGLVEVTVRQQVDFDLNEAGILFRANLHSHVALAFVVTPSGEWHLNRYTIGTDGALTDSQTLRYEGTFFGIRAVHKGLDVTNRLAVLMQRSSYTFFVNGQFVGGYTANDLPLSGQIGVYAEGMDGPITFSDLVIAPA